MSGPFAYAGGHAFITGGAGGIGLSIGQALVARGMKVTLADFDGQRLAAAVAESRAGFRSEVLDVTDEASWQAAIQSAEAAMGAIRILVNSAGTGGGGMVGAEDSRRWRLTLETNAFGSFLGANGLIPKMKATGLPCWIVNIASLAGLHAQPSLSGYTASKHAVVGMSDTLRIELSGSNVGISVVYPGAVNTGFIANRAEIVERKLGLTEQGGADMSEVLKSGMDPAALAQIVVEGIAAGDYHIHTHGGWRALLEAHFADKLAGYGEDSRFAESQDMAQLDSTVRDIVTEAHGRTT